MICISAIMIAGCSFVETGTTDDPVSFKLPSFHAGFDLEETKVYTDNDLVLHWNEADKIKVFFKEDSYQNGYEYKFQGEDGDLDGEFKPAEDAATSITPVPGEDWAVYSSGNASITGNYLTVVLPEYQSRFIPENGSFSSFGSSSNTMLARSTTKGDNKMYFPFKNLCGYLVLKLYGKLPEDVYIDQVIFEGNDKEQISGEAKFDMAKLIFSGFTPADNRTSIAVNMAGVKIGETKETATEVWFVVPPTRFYNGFTVTVVGVKYGENGGNDTYYDFVKATTMFHSFTRNVVNSMSPIEVIFDEEFDDATFREYCYTNFDTDNDGELSDTECAAVKEIDCSGLGITSLTGITRFRNLEVLKCGQGYTDTGYKENNISGELDLTWFPNLKVLDCSYNKITSLKGVSDLTGLTSLNLSNNLIGNLDVSNLTGLTLLDCSSNQINTLDVSKLADLEVLRVSDNRIGSLDISNNLKLTELQCSNCGLTKIDNGLLPNLKILNVTGNTLGTLDLSNNPLLTELYCGNCGLTALDVSDKKSLERLICRENALGVLDVSACTEMIELNFAYCGISEVDVSKMTKLDTFWADDNNLTSLDLSNCPAIRMVDVPRNKLESIKFGTSHPNLFWLYCNNNCLKGVLDLTCFSMDSALFLFADNNTDLTEIWLPKKYEGRFIISNNETTSKIVYK